MGACIAPLAYEVESGKLDERPLGLRRDPKSRIYGLIGPPSILQRMERKGEEPKAQGDGEVC